MSHLVETMFVGSGIPAWHYLGNQIAGQATSQEALGLAGLDWEVEKKPITFPAIVGGQEIHIPIEDKMALVRTSDNAYLGTVGPNYTITQNAEAFAFMDLLLGDGVRYESAGSLRGGQLVWMLAAMPEDIVIAGDAICPYVFLITGHDGHTALKVSDTHTRVVCANTVNLALKEAVDRMWKTAHLGDMKEKVTNAKGVLAFMKDRGAALKKEADLLCKIKLSEKRAESLIHTLYPDTGNQTAKLLNGERRSQVWKALNAEDLENVKMSGWAFVNAVADVVDHCTPLGKRNTLQWAENRLLKVVGGHEKLDLAHQLVLAKK